MLLGRVEREVHEREVQNMVYLKMAIEGDEVKT